jgi:hypothetical protein
MNAETIKLAIEALLRIAGEANGVEIETIWKDTKDNECIYN